MQRAYYDTAGHYFVPSEGVTLASLGVPRYSPPVEDWDDDEFGFAEASRFGAIPPAAWATASPGGISFADMVRTISPAAQAEVWRDDNSAPFWISEGARAVADPAFDDFVRTIDSRANPDAWRDDNSAPPYVPWEGSDRYSVPYDTRAAALGAFRIPGLPEDATGWDLPGRSPDRVGEAELPTRLAAMYNRILGAGLATEFTPREGGPRGRGISGSAGGGGSRGGGGGSGAPQGSAPSSASGPIYREGGRSPSNLKPRPGEDLSFRDSLSNPYPTPPGGRPVFRPGKQYIEVDASKLPPGSVHPDNVPPGHVTVRRTVPWEMIRQAIMRVGRFPK